MSNKLSGFQTLTTPFESELTDTPYTEYPRPSMVRDSYLSLNGWWDFTVFDKENKIFTGNILVPFAPQSKISGVYRDFPYSSKLVYERSFELANEFIQDRVIIHFGAVDRLTTVYINDRVAFENDGGYLPFSVDITNWIKIGKNDIRVEVWDNLDSDYPYGKQSKKRGGMWYTPISGIWQSVWLESVCEKYIEKIYVSSDTEKVEFRVFGGENIKRLTIHFIAGDRNYEFTGDTCVLALENPMLWSPENPCLYNFTIASGKDVVRGYFAMRAIEIKDFGGTSKFLLNGKPIYMHGLLDQGYFSDGIFLPATPEGYKNDILTAKKLGFNMLRKHIKIEPELFYYYCDKYGMLVWQDMVNSGKYSFLDDTALPTIGFKKLIKPKASKKRARIFEQTAKETVKLLKNHPSVVYYTIFNEGWGQYDSDRIYRELKTLDGTRIYDSTSGWFTKKESDVESLHVYFKPVKIKKKYNKPVVLSEFGGYSYKITEHSFNLNKTYGYKLFNDINSFENALAALYENEVIPAIAKGLCASCLTQISDVEDETNGLLTYDRQMLKVDEVRMKLLSDKLYKAFDEQDEKL